jgi:hypothetical protein
MDLAHKGWSDSGYVPPMTINLGGLEGDCGNLVDPDRNCYVAPGQNPQGRSSVALSFSPATRLGLSPIAIASALIEKSVHLQGC